MSKENKQVAQVIEAALNKSPQQQEREALHQKEVEAALKASDREWQRFSVIMIEQTRNDHDIEDPPFAHNLVMNQYQRGKFIPLPRPYVTSLKETKHPIFRQEPGLDRMEIGTITRYPFSVIYDDISKEAYEALRDIAKTRPITEQELHAICSRSGA